MLPRQDSSWLQGTVSDSKQSYRQKYELCKRPTLVQKWASWKKYHKQDDGKDFYQSRVIRAVHESLHLRIDCHFFVSVSARRGRKKNLCNHKAQRWTEPYPLHQRDNKRTKKRMFKDFKGHISANNSLFSKKLQESRAKIAPARQPVLAQTQILSLFSKTNLFP